MNNDFNIRITDITGASLKKLLTHFPVLDKTNIERQQFAVDLQMGG